MILQKVAGAWVIVERPYPRTGGAWRTVDRVWVKAGTWRLVWPQPPEIALTLASPRWDQMQLSWVLTGAIVDTYTVTRGAVTIASGLTATSLLDAGLSPATAYTYTVRGYRDDELVAQTTATASTLARADAGLTATAERWDRIALAWADSDQGSVDSYRLKRGATTVYTGAAKSYNDYDVLLPSTAYTYTLECLRAGAVVATDTASATTSGYSDPGLVASAADYNTVNLSWTDASQGSVNSYNLYRNGALIYQGAAKSHADAVSPGTGYNYSLDCVRSGTVVKNDTASASTPGLPGFGVGCAATAYNQTHVWWTNLGAGWTYYLQSNVGDIGWVGGTDYYHNGLWENAYFSYNVLAHYEGIHYLTASAGATTPARPVSYGIAWGLQASGSTGWTGSTQRYLTGNDIYVPIGGTFTNMALMVYSHAGQAFRGEPRINGVSGAQQVYTVGRTFTNWPFNLGFGAGTFTTGVVVGGTNWGQAEWSPWSGQRWDYYVCCDHLDYWYYASAVERIEEQRALPWHREELEGRGGLRTETWSNEDGTAAVRAKVTDIETGEVLVDWAA